MSLIGDTTQKPEPILIADVFDRVSKLGSVHNAEPCAGLCQNMS